MLKPDDGGMHRSRCVLLQRSQSFASLLLGEAIPPTTDCLAFAAQSGGNVFVGHPLSRRQHDLGSQHQSRRSAATTRPLGQHGLFFIRLKWTPIFGPVVKVDLGSGVGTLDEVVSWRHQEVQDGADTTSI